MAPPQPKTTTPKTDEQDRIGAIRNVDSPEKTKRELFPDTTEKTFAFPDEKPSQTSNNEWVTKHGAKGLIKLTGEGRTVEIVRGDMHLYKLGLEAATLQVTARDGILMPPKEKSQAAHSDWVKATLPDTAERVRLLPLTGEGRTLEAVAADIELVMAGAKHAVAHLDKPVTTLPNTASQATNNEWVTKHGAKGVIKLTGEGRTVEVVRRDMALYKLGAEAFDALAALVTLPEEQSQSAHNEWVKANLQDVVDDERKRFLPLTGEGRTVEAVGADIALVVAGAKHVASAVSADR